MDFKNMIGNLFFDRAKNVPQSKQLSEDLVNSMYGTKFKSDAYRMVVLCVANLHEPDLQEIDERMHRCTQKLVERLSGECYDLLYHFDHLRIRLLLNYHAEMDARILFLLRSQVSAVPPVENGSYPIVACCSKLHTGILDIGTMMEEASNIMWTRFSSHDSVLIHLDQAPSCPKPMADIFTKTEQTLKSACAVLDVDGFQKELDAFFSLPDDIITHFETRVMIRAVESYLFDVNRDLISNFADASLASREMVLVLRTATSLEEYKRKYRNHLVLLMKRIIDHSSAHLSRPIRKAQLYIQQHYAHPLHLEEVAAQVGLSPVYLCSRFKEEVGIGFSEYCNQCRIQQAEILLEQTDRPIVEIALTVGYSGPRYFSRVFLKQVGIRPSQYRKAARLQEQQ